MEKVKQGIYASICANCGKGLKIYYIENGQVKEEKTKRQDDKK
jgi:hypothetical protein